MFLVHLLLRIFVPKLPPGVDSILLNECRYAAFGQNCIHLYLYRISFVEEVLRYTSSDYLLIMHLSLENSCAQVLWQISEDFYIQRCTILLAFQWCQHFSYYHASFSCNFHFSDATPTWRWAEFTKSAQIAHFCIIICAKNSAKLQFYPFFMERISQMHYK